jgi:hypothetical protein
LCLFDFVEQNFPCFAGFFSSPFSEFSVCFSSQIVC